MAYLGNVPARSFISFERQVFTIVNSQTAYTLSHSVTNENDIRLVVNNVVQEPGSGKAYTATGTTLTLSAALVNGTDEMYCVFLGRATATNAPGAGSVGTAQIADDAVTNAKVASTVITGQTAETSIATDDLILLSDTSASGALRKMTRANFVSGIGGTNTPAFLIRQTSAQSFSNNTYTKVAFDTAVIDTDSGFDNSNDRWTVPTGKGGKYLIAYQMMYSNASSFNINVHTRVNGATNSGFSYWGKNHYYDGLNNTSVMTLSAGDYIELWSKQASGGSVDSYYFDQGITLFLSGYKIIE